MKNSDTIYLLIFVLSIISQALSTPQTRMDRVTYTRGEILEIGVRNTAELIKRNPYLSFFSIDDYNFYAQPDNPALNERYIDVFINQHRIKLSVLNTTALNAIPVSISSIDTAVFYPPNSIVEGRLCKNGAIQLIADLDKNSAMGGFSIGNEINDPGPYLFVEEKASINVDKIGIDGWFTGFGYYNGLGGVLSVQRDQYFFTDKHIYYRNNSSAKRSHYSSFLGAYDDNALFLNYSRKEDALFINTIGTEVTALSSSYNLDYIRDFGIFSLNLSGNLTKTERLDENQSPYLDLTKNENHLTLSAPLNNHQFSYTLINANYKANDHSLHHIYHNPSYLYEHENYRFALETKFGESQSVRLRVLGDYTRPLSERTSLSFSTSIGRETFLDNFEFINLTEREQLDIFSEDLCVSDNLSKDFFYQASFTPSLTHRRENSVYRFFLRNSYYRDLIYQRQTFVMDPSDFRFYSPVTLKNSDPGFTGFAGFQVRGNYNKLNWQSTFEYLLFTAGSYEFRDLFDKRSNYSLKSSLRYNFDDRFFVNLTIDIFGKQYHYNYLLVPESYSHALDPVASVDLNFTKYLFRDYLKTTFSFQNIFNQNIVTHPVGAGRDFALFFKAEVWLW
ncbi:hypothetical protein QA601_03755 [Chitinispirillales bacterium ANBcel5]|uniref:hypothetical protein n=1 Tax=Cellulosispirillum alkaliphilum TaxID=3039283 RepID=UPI002A530B70|nr:hypothetical protein [Chitinispirillales bacterium ANBcel5]